QARHFGCSIGHQKAGKICLLGDKGARPRNGWRLRIRQPHYNKNSRVEHCSMPINLPEPIVFGDTSGNLDDHTIAAAQTITNLDLAPNSLIGDADMLSDHAVGGNDTISSQSEGDVTVIGDALTITDQAAGGDD